MQDRFKFRVFDTRFEKMDYEVEKSHYHYYYNHYCPPLFEIAILNPKYLILMQCTGLKDKNNKLIFEGDIVKCGEFIYRVAYDDIKFASFVLIRTNKLEMFKHYFGEAVDSKDVEVIGNIYENSELITEEMQA